MITGRRRRRTQSGEYPFEYFLILVRIYCGEENVALFVIESSREETGSAKDDAATDADAEDDDYKDEDEDEEYLDEEGGEEEEEDPEAGRCRQKYLLQFLFSFFLF